MIRSYRACKRLERGSIEGESSRGIWFIQSLIVLRLTPSRNKSLTLV
jgi:hypothetical protein